VVGPEYQLPNALQIAPQSFEGTHLYLHERKEKIGDNEHVHSLDHFPPCKGKSRACILESADLWVWLGAHRDETGFRELFMKIPWRFAILAAPRAIAAYRATSVPFAMSCNASRLDGRI